jgi:hypothetical protein
LGRVDTEATISETALSNAATRTKVLSRTRTNSSRISVAQVPGASGGASVRIPKARAMDVLLKGMETNLAGLYQDDLRLRK